MSVFEDQKLERTDFAVVHDSSSIGAGPSVALFKKLEDGELSDKVLLLEGCHQASHMAAAL